MVSRARPTRFTDWIHDSYVYTTWRALADLTFKAVICTAMGVGLGFAAGSLAPESAGTLSVALIRAFIGSVAGKMCTSAVGLDGRELHTDDVIHGWIRFGPFNSFSYDNGVARHTASGDIWEYYKRVRGSLRDQGAKCFYDA